MISIIRIRLNCLKFDSDDLYTYILCFSTKTILVHAAFDSFMKLYYIKSWVCYCTDREMFGMYPVKNSIEVLQYADHLTEFPVFFQMK